MASKKDSGKNLTAKERKAQRNAKPDGSKSAEKERVVPAGIIAMDQNDVPGFLERNKLPVIAVAVFLAIVLIVMAVLVPVVFLPMYEYRKINNPVAVINLSNGDKIELEIYEKEVPVSATNFLYLAQKGFFNDTVIFDTTRSYVRFGQYQSVEWQDTRSMTADQASAYESKIYRTLNTSFTDKITDIKIPGTVGEKDSIFDYRIVKEDDVVQDYKNKAGKLGYISNIHNLSGTEFQICGSSYPGLLENPHKNPGPHGSNAQNMEGFVFGMCATPESMAVVEKIAQMEQEPLDNNHIYWTTTAQKITIKNIRIYKLDKRGKWRNFVWNDYFNDGTKVNWTGGGGRL